VTSGAPERPATRALSHASTGGTVQLLARSNAAATAAIAGAAHSGLARLGVEEALVLLELEPSDHAAVNRVGAVGDAQGAGHRV
jgi:hypothetical protein